MAEKPTPVQDEVNILQFIHDWHAALNPAEFQKTENTTFQEYLKGQMEIDDAMVSELDTVCGHVDLQTPCYHSSLLF